MSRLTRRALFALPVALPVAAVAAKVVPGLANPPKPHAVGTVLVEEMHFMSGDPLAYEKIRQQILAIFADLQTLPPGTFWCPDTDTWQWPVPIGPVAIGIDAGGNDDKIAVAVVQRAQPVEA